MNTCLATNQSCDPFLERYEELFELNNLDVLKKVEAFDRYIPDINTNLCSMTASFILCGFGVALRKKGLSKISQHAWEFCQNSCARAHFELSAAEFSFAALQSSRYLQICGTFEGLVSLNTYAFPLIFEAFQSCPRVHSDEILDLFYCQRTQLIKFPLSTRISGTIRINFDTGLELDWADDCTCGSCIPYGECCGLYR